jgi:CubicO group peptidase (beta-lactamase class C family)
MRLLLVFLFGVVLAPAAHAQGLGRGTAEAPVTEWPTADPDTMGMDRTRLRVDEYYNTVTFGSAETTLSDLARIGQLMLSEGRWNGTQIVPASWIERSTTPTEATPNYGFLWWIDQKRGNYAATGSLDNLCIVVPELDLVVARMQRDPQPDAGAKYQRVETLKLLRKIVEGAPERE